jgi:F0F1-type ATP synthase delta subunit
MNDKNLKQLAALSISDGRIDEKVSVYVLSRLSKSEMKRYLLYLRNVIRDRRVRVRTPGTLDAETRTQIAAGFAGRDIGFEQDPSLGAGLQVEYGDTIVNANIRTMIETTINRLKENL